MTYPPEWPAPGKMHFRLVHDRIGNLDLDCDHGYVVGQYNLGFPEIREVKMPNSLDDGTFDVTRFFGARAVSLDITLKTHRGIGPASASVGSSEAALRDKLFAYLYPGIRPRLLFSEHGDTRVRQILLRGSPASAAVSQPAYNKVNAAWVAPRGTLYSYDERCYTFRFGETSGDTMTLAIVNEGTVPVTWRASISGYSLHPRFILNGTEILRLDYIAQPGDFIQLDSFSQTITINGQPASYAYIQDDAVWFRIPPGMNTLTVEHAGGVSAYGYPYARWQEAVTGGINDLFERADGPLGASWVTPAAVPDNTVAVPLQIEDGGVIVSEPDGGVIPHEWGYARNTTALTGGVGQFVEVSCSNLAQTSPKGPIARSSVELYTHMNASDAACQALAVDFDFGVATDPTAPVVFQEPFETFNEWTVSGPGATLAAGRNGSGLQVNGTDTSLAHNLDIADHNAVVVVGIAFKINGVSSRNLLELRGNGGISLRGALAVQAGSLYATDAAGVNKGGSLGGTVTANTWHYAEVRYVVSNTVGEFGLRLDGLDVAQAFDIDTGIGVIDQIRIPTPNATSGGTNVYDDLYVAVGDDATFIGPVDVANGSLAWEMHQYAAGGAAGAPTASGVLPYNYTATAVKLRFESRVDGGQRFMLDDVPVAEAVDADPVTGTLVGFGSSYSTVEYAGDVAGTITDDFERSTLGTDWVLPTAATSSRTVVLPTIQTGAVVPALHSLTTVGNISYSNTVGASLAGGVVQTLPTSGNTAGYLALAHVVQDGPGMAITASDGWTSLGAATLGAAGGDFMEAFDNYAVWNTVGAATTVAARTGNGARITGVATSNHADYRLPSENATVVVGFAHQINSLAAATSEICQWYSDTNVTQHNRLTVATNGSLSFWRGTTNLGTSAAGIITINTWNYIEVSTVLSDTVGAVTVRVNGTAVLTLTAQDTQNAGTKTVYDTFRLCGPIASFYNTFDDLYLVTGAAAFKGSQTIAVSSGTELMRVAHFARVFDGTSKDLLTLTGAAKDYASAISSWYVNPTPPGLTGFDVSRIKVASATGLTGLADPPSLTLDSQEDWLFIASAGYDVQALPSINVSSGYSSFHGTPISPGNLVTLRSGSRAANQSAPEDPGTFSSPTGRPWIAFTMAIPGGKQKWGAAEYAEMDFTPAATLAVEAEIDLTGTGSAQYVELYTHMVSGSPACRVLQVDTRGRTWRLGHFPATGPVVVAASGALPGGAAPFTLRFEGDPDGTARFLFNGALVQSINDATVVNPTGPVHVGFGQFTTYTPHTMVKSFTATGTPFVTATPMPDPTPPRIERFVSAPMSGTDWAYTGVGPPNNAPPGGKPPWAWTPPVDPLTGEPSILSVHFCFYDQWL